jgi:hypothetical protein
MTKILNLDELGETVAKSIVYKGKTHDFAPMSVEDFIQMVRSAEEKEKEASSEEDMATKFGFIRESVGKAFPTLNADLGDMPITHLMAIFDFLQRTADGDLDKAVKEYQADEGKDQEPETPTK